MSFAVEAVSSNVHTIRFDNVTAGWRQYVLLSGDRHHDNANCDQRLEKRHLDMALERGAPIIDNGDAFDAMEGKWDPRKDYDSMRPEYAGNNYLDRLIDVAENFYRPYAHLFAVMGRGNHETAMLKRHETDLTARLARRLRSSADSKWPYAGGYGGWIFFRFTIQKTVGQTIRLKYYHGSGGGGPVTRGVIQTNRRAVFLPDADIVVSSHIHSPWVVPITRERISQNGKVYRDTALHVSLPTYKDEYQDGSGGYHIEKGRDPRPIGCAWLIFEYQDKRVVPKIELDLN